MTLRALMFAEDTLGVTLARDLYDRVVIERGPPWMVDLWSDAAIRATQRTPLDHLERYGAKMGLPDYLADVARIIGVQDPGASGGRHAHAAG